MKIKRIHHVAIAVENMGPLEHLFGDVLGLEPPHRESGASGKLDIAIFPIADTSIELLKPNGPGTSVPDFIAQRGEGLFHVCLEVEDIDAAMAELRGKGIRFRTETAQPGHAGSRIAFMDTATTAGVLFELLEAAKAA
jgi:methylmalonyl-CoA/ethylmalonyl-CoA epimerase